LRQNLKVLPDGLVVDSGLHKPDARALEPILAHSPARSRQRGATNLVEGNQPEAHCIGLIFLTDLPNHAAAKPKVFDYVNVEASRWANTLNTSVGKTRANGFAGSRPRFATRWVELRGECETRRAGEMKWGVAALVALGAFLLFCAMGKNLRFRTD